MSKPTVQMNSAWTLPVEQVGVALTSLTSALLSATKSLAALWVRLPPEWRRRYRPCSRWELKQARVYLRRAGLPTTPDAIRERAWVRREAVQP